MVDFNNIENPLRPAVRAICLSEGGIPKRTVYAVRVSRWGLVGDGHNHAKHNRSEQAVCLQDWELLRDLSREGFSLNCGTIGENLTVENLQVQKLTPGTILRFSGGVTLELTKERKPCYVLDSIDPRLKEVIAGRCGFYARVLAGGVLTIRETIDIGERPFSPSLSESADLAFR